MPRLESGPAIQASRPIGRGNSFRNYSVCVRISPGLQLPDGVIGNIQEFDSCVTGSIPVLVTNGGCSLSGKASDCASVEQGSPESFRDRGSPNLVYRSMEGY